MWDAVNRSQASGSREPSVIAGTSPLVGGNAIALERIGENFQVRGARAYLLILSCDIVNVMWGLGYPRLEDTYGHTKSTLHGVFAGVAPEVSEQIRIGAFNELFPHVSDPPQ